ncbi:unnamed protein product [Linum tenue]|uniref:Ubiquitin-like domain-containing protein n=1 Tax=Linum tenue TaxID=586396 RepID=A0AAV0ISQ1_9ROSI|nr:unnamed protein product [Linum tenue]
MLWGVTVNLIGGGKILPEIEVSLSFTIIQIKEILASRLSITTSRQQMFYDGTHINNNETLESYEFENDDESDVELNLKVKPLHDDRKIKSRQGITILSKGRLSKCARMTLYVADLKRKLTKKMKTIASLLTLSCQDDQPSSFHHQQPAIFNLPRRQQWRSFSDYPPHLLGEDDGLLPFPMTTTKNLRNDKDEETVSCGSNREETCKLCF